MTNFYVDYKGFLYLEADSEHDANQMASKILSEALPYDFHGGDWEISKVEENQ